MMNGIGTQGYNLPGVGATRPSGPVHTPAPVVHDDDAAFNFLESWTSNSTEKGQLSLNDMLKLQSSGGSEVPQTVAEPPAKTEEHLTREIEFLVKTNRNVFQAHGSLGSAGISDGWQLSH